MSAVRTERDLCGGGRHAGSLVDAIRNNCRDLFVGSDSNHGDQIVIARHGIYLADAVDVSKGGGGFGNQRNRGLEKNNRSNQKSRLEMGTSKQKH